MLNIINKEYLKNQNLQKRSRIYNYSNSFYFTTLIIFLILLTFLPSFFLFGCKKEENKYETFTVARGNIVTQVTSTGNVYSSEEKKYSVLTSAKVIDILQKGDSFKKDDILIKIDDSKVRLYISQAEQNLKLAEESINIAKINYQSALDSNHVAIQLAESSNNLAEITVQNAFQALDSANSLGMANIEAANQAIKNANYYLEKVKDSAFATDLTEAQAETNVSTAEKALEQAKKSAKVQSVQAESAYNQALANQSITYWNNLNNLEKAQTQIKLMAKNIAQSQIQLELAKINLELAKLDLDNFFITAPFDGFVKDVSFSVGETASPGVPAISIVSSDFIIKSDINETDIVKIKVGQEVEFTLDAYPDKVFYGKVDKISPVSKNTAGIITFEVTIKPEKEAFEFLQYGFSVNVTITVSKNENVLYVPIQAVYEENGKNFVDVLKDENNIIKTEVITGASDYDYIEIKSGLSEGNIIILTTK